MKAFLICLLLTGGVYCDYRDEVYPINRPPKPAWKKDFRDKKLPGLMMTTPGDRPVTDPTVSTLNPDDYSTAQSMLLSGEEVKKIVNLDYGKYDRSTFEYTNHQDNLFREDPKGPYTLYCIEQFLRCKSNAPRATQACAYNFATWREHRGYAGYFTGTYCQIHFDNCRRGFRAWRILDYGECRFTHGSSRDDVFHARRMANPNLLMTKIIEAFSQDYNN